MKLILKIAAGVFLGIGAILITMSVAGRITRNRQEATAKANAQAAALKFAKELEPYAPHTLADMTPEDLVGRCGKPSKDETTTDQGLTSRSMAYRLSPHSRIKVLFSRNDDPRLGKTGVWSFAGFVRVLDEPPYVDTAFTGFDEKAGIKAMPCLSGGRKSASSSPPLKGPSLPRSQY